MQNSREVQDHDDDAPFFKRTIFGHKLDKNQGSEQLIKPTEQRRQS